MVNTRRNVGTSMRTRRSRPGRVCSASSYLALGNVGSSVVKDLRLRRKSWSCTFCRNVHPGLPGTASSSQVPRRHPEVTTYRCCLPALAGFVGFRRVGPSLHRHLNRTVPKHTPLEEAFDPARADCRSPTRRQGQGTASSPSSTTNASLADNALFVKTTMDVGNCKSRAETATDLSNVQFERRGRDLNPRGSSPTRSPIVRTRPDYATSPGEPAAVSYQRSDVPGC